MTDTMIKGSGNSRSIKSVPNLAALAPTYDKLLELLTGEGLPIDLGPLNDAGLAVRGNDLNKSTLLTDETETALWGNANNRTPREAFDRLRTLIATAQSAANQRARIIYGTYNGTYKNGPDYPNSLSFPFDPKFILIMRKNSDLAAVFLPGYLTENYTSPGYQLLRNNDATNLGAINLFAKYSNKLLSWYCGTQEYNSNIAYQMNNDGQYHYIAIG